MAALVLSYLAVAEALPIYFMEAIHAHGTFVPYLVRLAYNVMWMAVAAVSLIGFWRNPIRRAPIIWVTAAFFAFVLALIPLDVALPHENTFIILLRFNVAFFIYVSVSLGDAAYLTERAYRKAAKEQDPYEDLANSVDINLIRTLSWIPLSLWALYVKPFFLIFPIGVFVFLVYLAVARWQLACHARDAYRNGQVPHYRDTLARPGKSHRSGTLQLGDDEVDPEELSRKELLEIVVANNRTKGMSAIDEAPRRRKKKKRHRGQGKGD